MKVPAQIFRILQNTSQFLYNYHTNEGKDDASAKQDIFNSLKNFNKESTSNFKGANVYLARSYDGITHALKNISLGIGGKKTDEKISEEAIGMMNNFGAELEKTYQNPERKAAIER